jgi:hypothetical protein
MTAIAPGRSATAAFDRTRPPSPSLRSPRVVAVAVAAAVAASAAVVYSLAAAVVVAFAVAVVVVVYLYPPAGAYIMIGATPLIAGIDRGVLPVVRPSEALAALVAVGLLLRLVPRLVVEGGPRFHMQRMDVSIVLLAIASSVLPLMWLVLRSKPITQDDLLYALVIWKYYGLFLIVRASVRTEQHVRRCLAIGMASACVVAVVAVLQSLKLFGVPDLLASHFYTTFGNTAALQSNRGSSTLGLQAAVADLMVFNIAVAWAWLQRGARHPRLINAAVAVFIFGAIASGQFAGVIALVLGAFVIVLLARSARPIVTALPVGVVAGVVLWPVIERRLAGFGSQQRLPDSWVARLNNLHTYFFPDLFTRFHYVLGVRPAARLLLSQRQGYVWIESGYTWVLWAGGIPLLVTFLIFVWVCLRAMADLARRRLDAVGTAATGAFVGVAVVAVLMVIDPHLTYRGSADMLFALLALASAGTRIRPTTAPAAVAAGVP